MTTRRTAENLLFTAVFSAVEANVKPSLPDMTPTSPAPIRVRVKARYCESCGAWAEVMLQPVRLRCTGCAAEAQP